VGWRRRSKDGPETLRFAYFSRVDFTISDLERLHAAAQAADRSCGCTADAVVQSPDAAIDHLLGHAPVIDPEWAAENGLDLLSWTGTAVVDVPEDVLAKDPWLPLADDERM